MGTTEVYLIMAQDAHVDIYGSQSEPDMFGPWMKMEDAKEAKYFLESMTKRSYSGEGRMPLYESVSIHRREVYKEYEPRQCF